MREYLRAADKREGQQAAAGAQPARPTEGAAAAAPEPMPGNAQLLGQLANRSGAVALQGKLGNRDINALLRQVQQRFGVELPQVRLHTDEAAAQVADAAHARALTVGDDIYFAEGAYQPQDAAGQELLRHELAHVAQVHLGRVPDRGGDDVLSGPQDALEQEAEGFARRAPRTEPHGGEAKQQKEEQQAPDAQPAQAPSPAVQGLRAVKPTPANFLATADIEKMTLSAFDSHAQDQADWVTSPKITVDKDRDELRQILEFARESPGALGACGAFVVGDIRKGLPANLAPLKVYSAAVGQKKPTVKLEQATALADAVDWGTELAKLEATPGGPACNVIMPHAYFTWMVGLQKSHGVIDKFINYCSTCKPNLQSTGGIELWSYVDMLVNKGTDPITYQGKLPDIKDYHRFQKTALDKLATNVAAKGSNKLPVNLILFTSMDWNGAFNTVPGIDALIQDTTHLTLLIQGAETLGAMKARIPDLAKDYCPGGKFDQVIVAGHGMSRWMEMAGTTENGQAKSQEPISAGEAKTQELFDELLAHMDPSSPNHRIVIVACLTASNEVGPLDSKLSGDQAKAAAEIRKQIQDNPSLATWLEQRAKDKGVPGIDVVGANASMFIKRAELVDPLTGQAIIKDPDDPYIAKSKLEYVEFGTEPFGAMKAVVETWADPAGPKACLDAMKRRLAKTPAKWGDAVIAAVYDVAVNNFASDGPSINKLTSTASNLFMALWKNPGLARNIWTGTDWLEPQRNGIFGTLAKAPEWSSNPHLPLVYQQIWMYTDPAQETAFLTQLGTSFNCKTAQGDKLVDLWILNSKLPALMPLPPATPPDAGSMVLALICAIEQGKSLHASAKDFLLGVLGAAKHFPNPPDVNAMLGGLASEEDVLSAIGKGQEDTPISSGSGSGSGATDVPANVDAGATGKTNTTHVISRTFTTKAADTVMVYAEPDASKAALGSYGKGAVVKVEGETDDRTFWAVQFDTLGALVLGYAEKTNLPRPPGC